MGQENPSELKAQKLARSVTRGLVDRDLKPDVEEKRRIDAILLYPPNRSCHPYFVVNIHRLSSLRTFAHFCSGAVSSIGTAFCVPFGQIAAYDAGQTAGTWEGIWRCAKLLYPPNRSAFVGHLGVAIN